MPLIFNGTFFGLNKFYIGGTTCGIYCTGSLILISKTCGHSAFCISRHILEDFLFILPILCTGNAQYLKNVRHVVCSHLFLLEVVRAWLFATECTLGRPALIMPE